MDSKAQNLLIYYEQVVHIKNILEPDYYYQHTFYPDRSLEKEPANPHFPPLEQVLKHYSNKAGNLVKQKNAILKLMAERDGKKW